MMNICLKKPKFSTTKPKKLLSSSWKKNHLRTL